jgi:hypothetical protein
MDILLPRTEDEDEQGKNWIELLFAKVEKEEN